MWSWHKWQDRASSYFAVTNIRRLPEAGGPGVRPRAVQRKNSQRAPDGFALAKTPNSAYLCRIAVEMAMSAKSHNALERLPANRQALALEGFFSIIRHWGADNDTARRILGAPPERTFYAWKRAEGLRLSDDTLR